MPAGLSRTEPARCMAVASSYSGAALSPPLPRRSRSALRATQSRNRYSTAMKPNLRATATGSSSMGSACFEGDLGQAELDGVAVAQGLRVADALAVDLDAVGGPEVADDPLASGRAQLR